MKIKLKFTDKECIELTLNDSPNNNVSSLYECLKSRFNLNPNEFAIVSTTGIDQHKTKPIFNNDTFRIYPKVLGGKVSHLFFFPLFSILCTYILFFINRVVSAHCSARSANKSTSQPTRTRAEI